ncbi:hypothetical protein CDL15_Pgr024557 [Punica granatum]|nr:hypothetical protein CDL15_Pgr024557 [Punica granatum]
MAIETVEIDFFGVQREEEKSAKSQLPPSLDRRRSFRGINGAISKINPELLKSVIGSARTANHKLECGLQFPPSVPTNPSQDNPKREFQSPLLTELTAEHKDKITPLTIFYNGTVIAFDVTHDKAENILKLAVEGSSQNQLMETLSGDLPIFRQKSLQRFLEKRKER